MLLLRQNKETLYYGMGPVAGSVAEITSPTSLFRASESRSPLPMEP
jgi:hypothetical protein